MTKKTADERRDELLESEDFVRMINTFLRKNIPKLTDIIFDSTFELARNNKKIIERLDFNPIDTFIMTLIGSTIKKVISAMAIDSEKSELEVFDIFTSQLLSHRHKCNREKTSSEETITEGENVHH